MTKIGLTQKCEWQKSAVSHQSHKNRPRANKKHRENDKNWLRAKRNQPRTHPQTKGAVLLYMGIGPRRPRQRRSRLTWRRHLIPKTAKTRDQRGWFLITDSMKWGWSQWLSTEDNHRKFSAQAPTGERKNLVWLCQAHRATSEQAQTAVKAEGIWTKPYTNQTEKGVKVFSCCKGKSRSLSLCPSHPFPLWLCQGHCVCDGGWPQPSWVRAAMPSNRSSLSSRRKR